MMASRRAVLLITLTAGCLMPRPALVQMQWWWRAPTDFEECADTAEQAATPKEKASALTECNAKFAGRRKRGGGYAFYDFMQNRSFDIAGPNPTPQEQKYIDGQYTEFLDQERRNSIASAFVAKQQQVQPASFETEPEKVPLPMQAPRAAQAPRAIEAPRAMDAPRKPQVPAADFRARAKFNDCPNHSFSCEWPRLSEGIKDLKKLFGSSQGNAKRGYSVFE